MLNKLVEIRQERKKSLYITAIDWPLNNVSTKDLLRISYCRLIVSTPNY